MDPVLFLKEHNQFSRSLDTDPERSNPSKSQTGSEFLFLKKYPILPTGTEEPLQRRSLACMQRYKELTGIRKK